MKTKFKQTKIGMIPEDWEVSGLAGHIEIIGGGTPKTTVKEYWDGHIPWISVVDFVGDKRWIYDTEKHITKKGLENSSTKLLHKGQLIISARGTVGELSQVTKDMAFNQSCYGIDGKGKMDNNFLYYLLKQKVTEFQRKGHGAVFNTITKETFNQIFVPIPELLEQQSIAKILSDLDSKIELNQQMNKTLEAIGKAIFKHWFIDFEFPDKEGKPYKSSGGEMVYNEELGKEIPKGWELKIIEDVVTVKGGSTPSTKNAEYWDGKINWCTPKDLSELNSPILLDTERKITESGLSAISSDLLPIGTVLLSSRAPIGYLAISEIPVAVNQGFIAIVCDKILSKYFMLFWLHHNMDIIESRAHGTTFQEINKTSFRNIGILVPSTEILNNFDKLVQPLYRKAVKNQKETVILSHLRDSLLPKLMSGKIRVPVEAT